jgi:hypothetical protein
VTGHQLVLTSAWDTRRRLWWFGRCNCGTWTAVPTLAGCDIDAGYDDHLDRVRPGPLARLVYHAASAGATPSELVDLAGGRADVLDHAHAFQALLTSPHEEHPTADVRLRAARELAT